MEKRHAVPVYKMKKNRDYTGLIFLSFITGALLGATITLGVIS